MYLCNPYPFWLKWLKSELLQSLGKSIVKPTTEQPIVTCVADFRALVLLDSHSGRLVSVIPVPCSTNTNSKLSYVSGAQCIPCAAR